MPVRETGPNNAWSQPSRPFSRPKPNPDRRHSRDFDRQRPRDPAETDSPLEQSGFELLVPLTAGTPLCDALGVQERKYSDPSAALMRAFTEGAAAAPLRSADRGSRAGHLVKVPIAPPVSTSRC